MHAQTMRCARRVMMSLVVPSLMCVSMLAGALPLAPQAQAAPEDIMVGAFDKVTGVPVMGAMLGIVRSGERVPTTPAVLDERLRTVERLLREMDARLRLVEAKLSQLQVEVVRIANIGRLRELQRVRGEIAAVARELLAHPTEPTRLAILAFRAGQQADQLRDAVDFDIWKWSDVNPATDLLRTRFRVLPSFELYTLALQTWITAIDMKSGAQPQIIVRDDGAALLAHAAFLRVRDGWRERLTTDASPPLTLPEHLRTVAYCRLEPLDTYADRDGNCTFVVACIDEMEETRTETGRLSLAVQPAGATTLCGWNPDQTLFLEGEEELRNEHGLELMTALAQSLERLARTGSLTEPRVWPFPDTLSAAVFSVPLDRPLAAPPSAAAGAEPRIKYCSAFGRGCVLSNVTNDAHWTFGGAAGYVQHMGSNLCLDVQSNSSTANAAVVLWPCNDSATQKWQRRAITNSSYAIVSRASGLCATVVPAPSSGPLRLVANQSRPLSLQPCDGRATQSFSNTDSSFVGPR